VAIEVAPDLSIPEEELEWKFIRASGPGGQNVNKVSSAVQLRFLLPQNTTLPAAVRARLVRLAGRRIGEDGTLLISARTERSQAENRRAALERLLALLRAALAEPKIRRKTRPTAGSRERRIESKKRRASTKRGRGTRHWD
jgi:ribosome-associated protein